MPPAPLIQEHTAKGEDIIPWLIALLVVAVLVSPRGRSSSSCAAPRRRRTPSRGGPLAASGSPSASCSRSRRSRVTAGATWTIVQIGESGSRAVWEGSFSDEPLDAE